MVLSMLSDGLSGGVIAGIVIGSLLAVAALISIAVILANRVKPVKACYR